MLRGRTFLTLTFTLCACGNPGSSQGAGSRPSGESGGAGTSANAGAPGTAGLGSSGSPATSSGGVPGGAGSAGSAGSAGLGGGNGGAGAQSGSGGGGTPGEGGTGASAGSGASAGAGGAASGAGAAGGASGAGAAGGASGAGAAGGASGAGTAGGTSGASGANGYQPCPTDGSVCKVLPFGDSITWGVGDESNAGYRAPLFSLAVTAGQRITFTGSLSNGPSTVSGQPFPMRNEGHSGWTISVPNPATGGSGVTGLIPSPAFNASGGGVPHIILMMIGTNDVGRFTGAQIAGQLATLIDKITGLAPSTTLVVAKITPVSWASTVVRDYNDAMPGLVQARASAGKHVLLADMNTGFDSATMLSADNLHPNRTGYAFMASRWYQVVGSLLPRQ